MAVEVERKFLLDREPAPEVLGPGAVLRQGYLAEEAEVEVRVRITATDAVLTVKGGRGRTRTEVEVPVDLAEAEALWPHTAGRRIDKVRHRVAVGDLVAEVDVYRGALDGLVVVEVELPDEATSDGFVPPDWFGRELTGDPAWSNAALARHGRPPDPAP